MQIGMTVLALVECIGELEIGVTVTARHGSVASAQRKAGLRVIELDLVLDYFPVRCRVAVDARQVQLAMGALRGCKRARWFRLCACQR